MNDNQSQEQVPAPARQRRSMNGLGSRGATAVVAAGLAAGSLVGGFVISHAATSSSSSSTSTPAAPGDSAGRASAAGRRGGPGGDASDQQTIAGAIGITTAQLSTELAGGKSIAAVAAAHNVSAQKVIDALVAAENQEIDAAVTAGSITRAQGDAQKAQTVTRVTEEVNETEASEHHGGGPHGQGGDAADQQTIADTIGITVAQLGTELSGGKTIAAVATAHNVSPQKVIDALVAAENKDVDAEVAAGTITKAQGDTEKAQNPQRVTDEVNGVRGDGHPGGGHRSDGGGPPEAPGA